MAAANAHSTSSATAPAATQDWCVSISVTCPNNAATPVAAATRLAQSLPDARLHVLQGAPHMMQIERSAEYQRAVQDFLGELDG